MELSKYYLIREKNYIIKTITILGILDKSKKYDDN